MTRLPPVYRSILIAVGCAVSALTVSSVCAAEPDGTTIERLLPPPGVMLHTTPAYRPAVIAGMKVHPDDPLQFDFLIDTGDRRLDSAQLQDEALTQIRYFLTALTIPEKDLWVNLSPYEGDRIIPDGFGGTRMGRDLLAQDYLLKQLTASMMYPEDALGEEFWERVYRRVREQYGITDFPAKTFNKVWIVPERADVHVSGQTVWVVDSRLRVMLEEDYLALTRHGGITSDNAPDVNGITEQAVREVLIPAIEQEVNAGRTFAPLRQIFQAVVLATWYKQNLRSGLLGEIYVDRSRTRGVGAVAREEIRTIYDRYVRAFERGVYDFIREDDVPGSQRTVPRRYYSGGAYLATGITETSGALAAERLPGVVARLVTDLRAIPAAGQADAAILADPGRTEADDTVNFLNVPGLTAALADFRRDMLDPSTEFGRWLTEWKSAGAKGFVPYTEFLKDIGRRAQLSGPVVYNPFGGMDALTGFVMTDYDKAVDPATDVVSFGLNHFGTPEKLTAYLTEFRERVTRDTAGRAEHPFLKYAGFDDYYKFYLSDRDKGLGLAALLRIMMFLDGEVEGLYYFDMQPGDGSLRFLTPEKLAARGETEYGPSAMIAFRDPADGRRKRFWYLQTNISLYDQAFDAFIDRFRADGLVLKATFENNLGERSFFVYRKVLAPVVRGQGRVVADVLKNNANAVIWRADEPPHLIPNGSGFDFGYSYPGNPIAYGDATELYTWELDEPDRDRLVYAATVNGRAITRDDEQDDNAALSEKGADPLGGIDLDSMNWDLRVSQDTDGFRIPDRAGEYPRVPVAGFMPVILNIEPAVDVSAMQE